MYTTFTFVESKTKGLARQARDILNIVEAKAEISKEDLIAQIVLDVKSKQKAERLLSYYKGQLITTGCMEERKHG
jgi:hypothetical protein|tara:strand:- start:1630 stop:1854 length:225 start_codon:yes stop_codon:yes gene_type:complete